MGGIAPETSNKLVLSEGAPPRRLELRLRFNLAWARWGWLAWFVMPPALSAGAAAAVVLLLR